MRKALQILKEFTELVSQLALFFFMLAVALVIVIALCFMSGGLLFFVVLLLVLSFCYTTPKPPAPTA